MAEVVPSWVPSSLRGDYKWGEGGGRALTGPPTVGTWTTVQSTCGCSALLVSPRPGGPVEKQRRAPRRTLPERFQAHPGPRRATWLHCQSAGLWTGRSSSSRCGRSLETCKDKEAVSRGSSAPHRCPQVQPLTGDSGLGHTPTSQAQARPAVFLRARPFSPAPQWEPLLAGLSL